MSFRSDISDKISKDGFSLFMELLSRFRVFFVLLLAIGLSYWGVIRHLNPIVEGIINNYPILIAIVLMNFSVIKVVVGFQGARDYLLALIGTALFIYYGYLIPTSPFVMREEHSGLLYIHNYTMARICWALFLLSIRLSKRLSTIIYFVLSYGIILYLYYSYELSKLYQDDYLSLLVIPIAIYALSMLALVCSKIMAGMRLQKIFDKAMKR